MRSDFVSASMNKRSRIKSISSFCKAEEGVAVATLTDDNAAGDDRNSAVWLIMNGTLH